jgi:hypothetical protein
MLHMKTETDHTEEAHCEDRVCCFRKCLSGVIYGYNPTRQTSLLSTSNLGSPAPVFVTIGPAVPLVSCYERIIPDVPVVPLHVKCLSHSGSVCGSVRCVCNHLPITPAPHYARTGELAVPIGPLPCLVRHTAWLRSGSMRNPLGPEEQSGIKTGQTA